MVYDFSYLDKKLRVALTEFWALRETAKAKGKDKTGRGEATSGKHLDPIAKLLINAVEQAGLSDARFFMNRSAALPGYFRPIKQWDLVVTHKGKLAIVIELKSQVGSYGNNFNNRVEEALGSAIDLQTTITEGALQDHLPGQGFHAPFRGWLMVLGEEDESTRPGRPARALFPIDEEFLNNHKMVSYSERYRKFAARLVQTKQYDAAAVITAKKGTAEYKGYGLDSFWRELVFFSAKLSSI